MVALESDEVGGVWSVTGAAEVSAAVAGRVKSWPGVKSLARVRKTTGQNPNPLPGQMGPYFRVVEEVARMLHCSPIGPDATARAWLGVAKIQKFEGEIDPVELCCLVACLDLPKTINDLNLEKGMTAEDVDAVGMLGGGGGAAGPSRGGGGGGAAGPSRAGGGAAAGPSRAAGSGGGGAAAGPSRAAGSGGGGMFGGFGGFGGFGMPKKKSEKKDDKKDGKKGEKEEEKEEFVGEFD